MGSPLNIVGVGESDMAIKEGYFLHDLRYLSYSYREKTFHHAKNRTYNRLR